MIMETVNKTIGLLRKLQNILPRSQLLPIKKIFIRSHLDYVEIIYDQIYNASFHQKLELLQYNACLGIIGAITDTSREKLQKELGSESLQNVIGTENYLAFKKSSTVNILIISSN